MGTKSFAIIGGGKMGEAILKGWLASDAAPAADIAPSDVIVVEPGEERRAFLVAEHGVTCVADASLIEPGQADVAVLAVKPQVMMNVLETVAANPAFGGGDGDGQSAYQGNTLFISIAAGIPTERLEAALPQGAPVVRVMPNMALSIGAGASGVCKGAAATDDQLAYVAGLFGCLGKAVCVDEADMDIVCALSGSGPAYVAAMVEALRDAAAAQGLDVELAETLALQTVLGTARLIDETPLSPAVTREAVCSPGGTTLAALDAMYQEGFNEVFQAGVDAAVRRSKELAQS